MLSPQLRNKVHGLWTMFWAAGMTNPLVAVEQITYLLFLRQLESLDARRVASGKPTIYYKEKSKAGKKVDYSKCKWSYITQDVSFALLNDTVFPWLRGLEKWLAAQPDDDQDQLRNVTGRLDDAYFVLDPNKATILSEAVTRINELFRQSDTQSRNADIMGDIFEHLLGEIQSSGKNGQFRTPRQIIRFMIEVLDPAIGSKVLDPACGTGGFLVNTLLHWRAKTTPADVVRFEWDGTPHRTIGGVELDKVNLNACFYGFDNDRTMVRIAWMNLILHDLEFPSIEQRDALSKRMKADNSEAYDCVLANPPFTGNVDQADLSDIAGRFPREKGKPLTTKSELLFVWLMLDALRIGGRAAVVVPDGVLFGNTKAHWELRRQLLFENTLEAVISLPGGVFQPYAGVKTSILIFQRAHQVGEKFEVGHDPRTREVWFYEVEDEAFTLNQKRDARPGQDNDLWDAQCKFAGRDTSDRYFQPDYWKERWRLVDERFHQLFPDDTNPEGQALGLHELFADFPQHPEQHADYPKSLEQFVSERQSPLIVSLLKALAWEAIDVIKTNKKKTAEKELADCQKQFDAESKKFANRLTGKNATTDQWLERDEWSDKFGWIALKAAIERCIQTVRDELPAMFTDHPVQLPERPADDVAFRQILGDFAKLDGYDVWMRSNVIKEYSGKRTCPPNDAGEAERKPMQLSWIVPVRTWATMDDWGDPPNDGEERVTQSTHDEHGVVKAAYLAYLRDKVKVFDTDGTVKAAFIERLDPTCIEAADLNLLAGPYKPPTFENATHQPPAVLIRALQDVHQRIQSKLGSLLAMVEGQE